MARLWSGGHSAPILCIAASSGSEGLLASGSEGGEVTVWSPEGIIIGSLTLPGEDDITSVVTSPVVPNLFISHGDAVTVLDLRNLKGPASVFQSVGEEEINALALNETGSALAVADDSGTVKILEVPGGKVCRTLRRHSNICSSVAFRPHRPNNLVSVGLDMQVILWGLQKTRPLWTLSLTDWKEDDIQQQPGQMFNPPLAHCVSMANCGNILGCAAEDGQVYLLRVGSSSKLEQRGAVKAHSQGASQAHFLNFLSHPYWLVSGGNDCHVALWDLSKHPVVDAGGNTHVMVPQNQKSRGKGKKKQTSQAKSKTTQQTEPGVEKGDGKKESETGKTGPKLRITHGEKINWVCPTVLKGEPSVIIADQSSSLSIYPLSQP